MSRARRRDARARRYDLRFSLSVAEEVAAGICWADYRHKLSPYLLPKPGASAAAAVASIELARAHEVNMDQLEDGTPGTPPSWPHWQGMA